MKKVERKLTKWEKIFVHLISDKGLVSKIYKVFLQLTNKKANNTISELAMILDRYLSNEVIQMDNK